MVRPKSKIEKYKSEDWRPKRDQKHGPGDYEITRLMTLDNKDKAKPKIVNAIVYERATLGVISKVRVNNNNSHMQLSDKGINLLLKLSLELTLKT